MEASKQREIASRGGRTAHAQGTAHKFSPEEARLAGRKGGKAVSGDRSHMARIGRRGGQARHARSLAQARGSEQQKPDGQAAAAPARAAQSDGDARTAQSAGRDEHTVDRHTGEAQRGEPAAESTRAGDAGTRH